MFRELTDCVFWQLKIRIIIFNVKVTFFNKMQQIQLANQVKKTQKTETEKTGHTTRPLRRFWKWEYKCFLDVVGIYLKQNCYENAHWKMPLQKRYRGSSPTGPTLSLSERERDRQRERQRETDRERQTDRQRETDRERESETYNTVLCQTTYQFNASLQLPSPSLSAPL